MARDRCPALGGGAAGALVFCSNVIRAMEWAWLGLKGHRKPTQHSAKFDRGFNDASLQRVIKRHIGLLLLVAAITSSKTFAVVHAAGGHACDLHLWILVEIGCSLRATPSPALLSGKARPQSQSDGDVGPCGSRESAFFFFVWAMPFVLAVKMILREVPDDGPSLLGIGGVVVIAAVSSLVAPATTFPPVRKRIFLSAPSTDQHLEARNLQPPQQRSIESFGKFLAASPVRVQAGPLFLRRPRGRLLGR